VNKQRPLTLVLKRSTLRFKTKKCELEFAELQALNRKPMYRRDWVAKLDDLLRLGERDILTHAGTISHAEALRKAELEFEKFRTLQLAQPSSVEKGLRRSGENTAQAQRQ
jgi:hypothetical protein